MTSQSVLSDYIVSNRERLFALIQDLVRCPSENMPPAGSEARCQQILASHLQTAGYQTDLYEMDAVLGLRSHPLFESGRDYTGRPNLAARRSGAGGGRSLILSGHIDTVPHGTQPWTRDPFSGHIENNRLYGRGSNDMKAGVAIAAFIMEALSQLDVRLAGDVIFESVIDEEFGGTIGTLAGRLRGYTADAAVLGEPSFLRICAAQRGGRTAHITFTAPGGILNEGAFPAGVIDQVTHFLNAVREFAAQRTRNCRAHPLYAHHVDPVPVAITKIITAPWGTSEPITTPEECKVELYWQLMPGEARADVEREFLAWFNGMVQGAPHLFPQAPKIEFPIRWLPGSAIDPSDALVRELSECALTVMDRRPPVVGIEGPCDMFLFHEFGIPAVLWGPCGGNTHAADEYVELDSVVTAAQTLLNFVYRWCSVAN
jgi:acetylornithine deacetylase